MSEKETAMKEAGDHFVNALLLIARQHGITKELEPAFLGWVGNECWEGREPENFMILLQRTSQLAKRFLEEQKT